MLLDLTGECYTPRLINASFYLNLGLFVGYTYRFDQSKSTFVYEIISFVSLLGGLTLWFVLEFFGKFPLPV
jgi:hypothetical protein